MRRTASPRFRKTLELARNVVNITFPVEFGTPILVKTDTGMAAMFPDTLSMQTVIDDRPVSLQPVGEGYDAESAVIDLFSLFADHENYHDILVTDADTRMQKKFIATESPYSTIIFQQRRPNGAVQGLFPRI